MTAAGPSRGTSLLALAVLAVSLVGIVALELRDVIKVLASDDPVTTTQAQAYGDPAAFSGARWELVAVETLVQYPKDAIDPPVAGTQVVRARLRVTAPSEAVLKRIEFCLVTLHEPGGRQWKPFDNVPTAAQSFSDATGCTGSAGAQLAPGAPHDFQVDFYVPDAVARRLHVEVALGEGKKRALRFTAVQRR